MSIAVKFKKAIFLIAGLVLTFGVYSCSEKKEAQKSIEQIRKEEGVSVKVHSVEKSSFVKELSFFSTLRGYEESTKGSAVGDRVLSIRGKVGSSVSQGQVIVTFPSNNPAIGYTQAKIALENSKKTYERMSKLILSGETSQQNVDNIRTQYEVDKRNLESLEQMINIEAPISGIITEIHVKEGDHVVSGDPLFTVAKLNKMIAKVWASEKEAMLIKNGMTSTVIMGGKEFKGTVNLIPLAMDSKTRAFGVEIMLDNGKRELKSGVTVEAKIKVYENPDAIVIPRKLVFSESGKSFVYIDNNGQATRRDVTLGIESGINIEIKSGLNVGDKLITEGQSLLSEGTKIKVIQ